MRHLNHFAWLPIALLAWGACGGDETASLDAPTVDPVASPTNESPISLSGSGVAGLTLQVRGGAEAVVSATIGADGRFDIDVPLRPDDDHTLLVSQVDGDVESAATEVRITHDGTAPDTPVLDPVTSPTRRATQVLRGTSEANATIIVRGGAEEATGTADASGRFDVTVTLSTAVASITENDLAVVAVDAAGNESAPAAATIVHNPNLPIDAPALDAVASPTSSPTVTVSGTSDPAVSISIAGGAMPVTTTAGADGSFSADVDLSLNTTNTISVFAVIPATGLSSPPATLVVVHDDVPPDPPTVDPLASPTGATTVRVTGASEALAAIAVSGGATDASTETDGGGAFSVNVMLTADAMNDLSVVATDAAGNASEATVMSVEQDSSLPEPVVVDPVASPTADDPIALRGTTTASAPLTITGGAATVMLTSESDGSFMAMVPLTHNARNELHVTREGSGVETIVVIVHDDTPPAAPLVDPIASPTNRTAHMVRGDSEAAARISVSGGVATASGTADALGRFAVPVSIPEDATAMLSVIATDRAGNASAPSTLEITHSSTIPDAPIVDEPGPPPTNVATHAVTGHIVSPGAGIDIVIRGGAATAMGMTDETTGAFSVEVTLQANMTNMLEVVSVEGAIESPPAFVTITHDDVAPTAPDGARISLGSPVLATCIARSETVNVTGGAMSVEASARVRVRNITAGALTASAMATADGSFATSIRACVGDLLRITATDTAGNESAPTERTVTD